MKPASLVTIIIRLFAIYLAMYALPFLGTFQTQLIYAVVSIVIAVLLYLWSKALGRLIAKGLD